MRDADLRLDRLNWELVDWAGLHGRTLFGFLCAAGSLCWGDD